ncbi:hypothetical protein BDK51DRAFT_48837 [Blyttiomyces helicus]|uniref:Uncharacterized protein n=1 Tax=Blyttiomyces helicus TaxID=388810 RepID=A0A4P9WE90_9FUNG|nr:hypothetical protein BDK51DRAFT_48837 [Blyttiomyces helicus]|eukprot:RKO90085.1 hypothetical protein BDK51DRAFT_48837 [Blyttiomyces helicus]
MTDGPTLFPRVRSVVGASTPPPAFLAAQPADLTISLPPLRYPDIDIDFCRAAQCGPRATLRVDVEKKQREMVISGGKKEEAAIVQEGGDGAGEDVSRAATGPRVVSAPAEAEQPHGSALRRGPEVNNLANQTLSPHSWHEWLPSADSPPTRRGTSRQKLGSIGCPDSATPQRDETKIITFGGGTKSMLQFLPVLVELGARLNPYRDRDHPSHEAAAHSRGDLAPPVLTPLLEVSRRRHAVGLAGSAGAAAAGGAGYLIGSDLIPLRSCQYRVRGAPRPSPSDLHVSGSRCAGLLLAKTCWFTH